MNWNNHSRDIPEGTHAFLGASTYAWLNYTEDKLVESYERYMAKQRGTELHAFAKECIRLKQSLPDTKNTLNMYVNDAIRFRMTPEQPLKYSDFCFGTADAISFYQNALRIHDLKTGATKPSMHQLEIYAALFCLEYGIEPYNINGIELRIYYNNDVMSEIPKPEDIGVIMDKMVAFDQILSRVKEEENER